MPARVKQQQQRPSPSSPARQRTDSDTSLTFSSSSTSSSLSTAWTASASTLADEEGDDGDDKAFHPASPSPSSSPPPPPMGAHGRKKKNDDDDNNNNKSISDSSINSNTHTPVLHHQQHLTTPAISAPLTRRSSRERRSASTAIPPTAASSSGSPPTEGRSTPAAATRSSQTRTSNGPSAAQSSSSVSAASTTTTTAASSQHARTLSSTAAALELTPSQLLDPSSPTAIEKALALGLTRDEYEETRTQLVNMLRGSQKTAAAATSAKTGSNAASTSSSASAAALSTRRGQSRHNSANTSADSPGPLPRLSVSSRKTSSRSTILSDSAPPSTSTLRTSISSSTNDDLFSPINQGSPATSDDEDAAHRLLVLDQPVELKETSLARRKSSASNDEATAADTSEPSKDDADSSFSAATAAAAALGMLASSPIKVVTNSPRGNSYSAFTQHRSNFSSSSPPPSANPSSGHNGSSLHDNEHLSSSADYLASSPPASRSPTYSSLRQNGNESAKSTTPVRTRLEDIALKSSAQIRRTRERLGLGEQEEMMDLDTDARHEAEIMRSLADRRGAASEEFEDEYEIEEDGDDDDGDEGLDRSLQSLAPAFAYERTGPGSRSPPKSPSRHTSPQRHPGIGPPSSPYARSGSHRRTTSYDMSRGRGMLDRFMETSASPKSAQSSRYNSGESSRRRSPERAIPDQQLQRSHANEGYDGLGGDMQTEQPHTGDQARRLRYAEDERNELFPSVQSTPRGQMDRKAASMRPADHEVASPMMHQIRMLHETDLTAGRDGSAEERAFAEQFQSPHRRNGGQASLGVPGSIGRGGPPEMGSARKRKASYQLTSPRGRVVNYETSSPPSHSPPHMSSPPPFPAFTTSSPRFYDSASRSSTAHPSSSHAAGLFDLAHQTPTKSHSHHFTHSQSASLSSRHGRTPDGQARPHDNASYPYSQVAKEEDEADIPSLPSSSQHPNPDFIPYSNRGAQAAHSEYGTQALPNSQYSHHQLLPPSTGKRGKAKKRMNSVASSSASQDVSLSAANDSISRAPSVASSYVPPKPSQYDSKTKPPFSYAALIGQAIFSTPNARMSLADIYTYIMTVYPFYKKQDAGWQNSIRHNLSLNECFVKTQRGPDEPGKGCLWAIQPGCEEQFVDGNFYKKGKIPKSASKSNVGASNKSLAEESSSKSSKKKAARAPSVGGGRENVSIASNEAADDSFDNASFVSASSSMAHPQPPQRPDPRHSRTEHQRPTAGPPAESRPHPQSRASYNSRQMEDEDIYEEEDDSMDMSEQPGPSSQMDQITMRRQAEEQHQQTMEQARWLQQHQQQQQAQRDAAVAAAASRRTSRHKKVASGSQLRHSMVRQDSSQDQEMDGSTYSHTGYESGQLLTVEEDKSYAASDRSGSAEPASGPPPRHPIYGAQTSPVRRSGTGPSRRALLTSPPIMSSPPTNVFARMSQPYQPLRDAFNIPGQASAHAAALMSSPPPSGIMPSDARMRRLPPPTPRSAARDEEHLPGSSIFLPAPNIRPGRSNPHKRGAAKGDDDDDELDSKPILPPIHMMSPASNLVPVNTQSPVSSIRGSAANRSTSPSPKSSTQSSTSSSQRSPTLNKNRLLHSAEVFKTPDRFGPPNPSSSSRTASPSKLAHLASNNASKALQSLQYNSTPKLPGSRGMNGMVTPGPYYDPYEYGAVVDEELDRMAKSGESDERPGAGRHGDRRPLPFPSPLDRTPKWQPWSPW